MSRFNLKIIFSLVMMSFVMLILVPKANATAAFARETGASCKKCHTVNFPRLNHRGEKFMLNGFQVKKRATGGFGLDDDETPEAGHTTNGKKTKDNKTKLPQISDILSITGQFNVVEMDSTSTTPSLGNPKVVSFTATGILAKNTPIWAGVDIDEDGASLHRYQIGKTNIIDSKKVNFRMGTLDPTTWTSVYGHGATIQSASSSIGSNGSGHDANTGFSTVGSGYAERNAFEYYGYTKSLLWSFAVSNESGHGHDGTSKDALDYWVTTKYTFMKNSSVSFLWYNANGSTENQTYTLGSNLRLGGLDLMAQFSIDNTGGTTSTTSGTSKQRDKWGLTAQANYATTKDVMVIFRYDSTDNGQLNNSLESHVTVALVFKPEENIKVTASYVAELKSVASQTTSAPAGDGHDHAHSGISARTSHEAASSTTATDTDSITKFGDHFLVNIRYMF